MSAKRQDALELVRQVQLGDESAATELFKAHWLKVLNVCSRFGMSDPESMAQEVMLQMFRKLGSYKGEAAFGTWLHRMAINICLMSRRRKQLDYVETVNEAGESWLENCPDGRNPEAAAIARLDLEKVVPALSYGYAKVLVDRYWLGYDIQETAKRIKRSVGDVKSQAVKARSKARKMLEGGRIMEQQLCEPCKEAGFPNRLAHYRSHPDGQGKTVPAKCYYHHLGQVPPWIRETQKKQEMRVEEKSMEDLDGKERVECKLKIAPDCEGTVAADKKTKICGKCWGQRIMQGKRMAEAAGTSKRQKREPAPKEEHELQPLSIQVGAGFVDQAWGMLSEELKMSALQKTWYQLPLEIRLKLTGAGLILGQHTKIGTTAYEAPLTMSVTAGQV